MAEYTKRQMESYGDHKLVENWFSYVTGYVLADVEYRDGICDVTVYDPTTSRFRLYKDRPTVAALGIVERHLERLGYKKCVEFHKLDGTIDFDIDSE